MHNSSVKPDELTTLLSTLLTETSIKTKLSYNEKYIEGLYDNSSNGTKNRLNTLTDNSSNKKNKSTIDDKRVNQLKVELENMLKNDEFDVGYESKSSIYFKKIMEQNQIEAKEALQRCFVDNYSNAKIIYGTLSIISDIEYDDVYPVGQAIALGSGNHINDDIKEATIRVFEHWCNEESLKLINNISFSDKWLDNYRLRVINDIRENLDDGTC